MKALAITLAALILVIHGPTPALSFVAASGERVIISSPQWDDTYLAGAKVVVDEEIGGDAIMAGASLIVTAPVAGDLNAAGVSVVVNGGVGDDLRALGGDINIGRDVGSDLLAFGGSVSLAPKVTISGDAALAAGNVHSSSTIDGSARIAGGKVVFDGVIRGDAALIAMERLEINGIVEGTVTLAAPEIILGHDAFFGGDVEYWRESGDLDFGRTLRSGVAVYNPDLRDLAGGIFREKFSRHGAAGLFALWLVASSLAGGLCLLLFTLVGRGYFQMAAAELQQAYWKSFSAGVMFLVLAPVAALLLLLSVIGIPLGVLCVVFYAMALLFATVTTAFVFTLLIEKKADAIWSRTRVFLTAFTIFLLLKSVLLVPFFGWFAAFLAFSSAFGAMMICNLKLFRQIAT